MQIYYRPIRSTVYLYIYQATLQRLFNMFNCSLPHDLKWVSWSLHEECILQNILNRQCVHKAGRNLEQLLVLTPYNGVQVVGCVAGPLLLVAHSQEPFVHLLIFQIKAIAREMLSIPKPMAKPFRTADHRQGAVKEKRNHSEQKPYKNWLWFYSLCPGHFHGELHYLEHRVCLHSAHGWHHCPCPAKLGPPHAPAHQPRAPFQLGLGPPVPVWASQGVSFSTSATALPLPGHRACWSSLWWLISAEEAPATSELEPPRHHMTPHAGRTSQKIPSCLSIEAGAGNTELHCYSHHVPAYM